MRLLRTIQQDMFVAGIVLNIVYFTGRHFNFAYKYAFPVIKDGNGKWFSDQLKVSHLPKS